MSLISYNKVFNLRVDHDYFSDGIAQGLIITPTVTTSTILDKYNFRLNLFSNGFDFYSKDRENLAAFFTYVKAATATDSFEFNMSTSDANFYVFTDLPIEWQGIINYSSQYPENKKTDQQIELVGDLSQNMAINQVAHIALYFDDIIKALEQNTVVEYQIKFTARSTQWHYYLINSSQLDLTNVAIKSTPHIGFEAPQKVTLQNQQDALLFSSGAQQIKLSKVPEYKLDLIENTTSEPVQSLTTYKTLFYGLPNASPDNFTVEQLDGDSIVISPMYVYI